MPVSTAARKPGTGDVKAGSSQPFPRSNTGSPRYYKKKTKATSAPRRGRAYYLPSNEAIPPTITAQFPTRAQTAPAHPSQPSTDVIVPAKNCGDIAVRPKPVTPKKTIAPPTSASSPIKNPVQNPKLNVLAAPCVPSWLTAVNVSPAIPKLCTSLEATNYDEYVSTFAGSDHLQKAPDPRLPEVQAVPILHSASPDLLSVETYGAYFSEALQNDVAAEATELRNHSIFTALLEARDPLGGLFRLHVPGLKERSPRVEIGDVLLVRPLVIRPDVQELTELWSVPGGAKDNGLCAPGFCGLEFHAMVWNVTRAREEVTLRIDGLVQLACNVNFAVQIHRVMPVARSIMSTTESLRTSQSAPHPSPWWKNMLFPLHPDCTVQHPLAEDTFRVRRWIDNHLNNDQQKAVDTAIVANYGQVPYLIFGPSGSGKTRTIVEMALQLLQRSPRHVKNGPGVEQQTPHILLCAPSDAGADELAFGLMKHLNTAEMLRLNGWSRPFAEVPPCLLPYSYVEKTLFALPSFSTLMSCKVVITTCRDADMLAQAQLTNQALGFLARTTLRKVAPAASSSLAEAQLLHWTALLVDDAGQATEPETLIPMTVIAPSINAQKGYGRPFSMPQVVLAGDDNDFGPQTSSKNASALELSLFSRLASRALYAQRPFRQRNGSGRHLSTLSSRAFATLAQNYRSHAAILSVPSQLSYCDTLVAKNVNICPTVRAWPSWSSPHRWPVLFVRNRSPDDLECVSQGGDGGTYALLNRGEAMHALELVQSLLEYHEQGSERVQQLKQHHIVVVSPFIAQARLLSTLFRDQGLYEVRIGPLHALPELKSKILVLCTTRTRRGSDKQSAAKFVREDQGKSLGVIGEPTRFNAALTRAGEGLIVLGDPETLTAEGDPCWLSFLGFCARNGCFMHDSEESADSEFCKRFHKNDMRKGRLEKALIFAGDETINEALRKHPEGFGYRVPSQMRQHRYWSQLQAQKPTPTGVEMWKMGLEMASGMGKPGSDGDSAQRHREAASLVPTDLIDDEDDDNEPDPWNPDRYPALGNNIGTAKDILTGSPIKSRQFLGEEARHDTSHGHRVYSAESAAQFDRDPKAEFERMDCVNQ